MRKSPEAVESVQSVPQAPSIRRWAARLALLVACVGSVATSSSYDASAEYEGPLLRLTPEQPTLTRTLVAQVSANEKSAIDADVSLTAQFTATWTPSDPTRQEKPKLRLKLQAQNDPQSGPGQSSDTVLEQSPQSLTLSAFPSHFEFQSSHEQPFTLTLELQPGAPPGTLEVAWKVTASAYTSHPLDSPKSFQVQLTER